MRNRLYVGPSKLFIQDTKNHQIRLKLRQAFYEYNRFQRYLLDQHSVYGS